MWDTANWLTLGSDGNLYGTTRRGYCVGYGDGTVFKVTTNGIITYLVLFNLNFPNGDTPMAGLTLGNDGNFYGTTAAGGRSGHGNVFKVTTNGVLTQLAQFTFPNGEIPYAGLTQGNDGYFYGTTYQGGNGYGNIFKVTTNGVLTSLVSFNNTNGAWPYSGLTLGNDGNLYGTTRGGGTNGTGTVFKVTTNGVLTSLVSFKITANNGNNYSTNANGAFPYGSLEVGSDGNFYGTTYQGGSNGVGTVFKITTNGVLTSLVSFSNSNGAYPYARLKLGRDGVLYGTTYMGGSNGVGTVFKVTTNGVLTSLVSFNNANGAYPYAGLTLDNGGMLYGTTGLGGIYNAGTVFSILTNGMFTSLVSFDTTNGANPYAGLTLGVDSNFYGTTYSGGASYQGTIFKVTSNGVLTLLTSFGGNSAGFPYAGLTPGADGMFYGTTTGSGNNGGGAIFRLGNSSLPSIILQPVSRTNVFNTTATFNVSAVGAAPLAYRWFKNGVSLTDGGNVSGSGTTNLSLANVSPADATNYWVVVTNNYGSVTSTVVTLTFLRATPVITWTNPLTITYGMALGASQLNAGSNVSGSFVYSPPTGTVLNAGTNILTAVFTPTDTVDYNSATSTVSQVVSRGPLTVTASNASRSYGETNPVFTGTLSGVVNADNITANYGCSATACSAVGSYLIIPGLTDPGNRLGNYIVTTNNGTLTVGNMGLVITASNTNKVYGQIITFSGKEFTASGLTCSDSVTNVTLSSSGVGSGAVVSGSPYTIVPNAAFGQGLSNYNVSFLNGSLTVSRGSLAVTASNTSRAYGETNPTFGGTLTGVTNGDNITATYSCTAVTNSTVGTYAIVPSLADPGNRLGNYTVTTNNGTLTVIKANPILTWSQPSATYGTALGASQLNASANVPGSLVYSPPAGTVLNAGTNTLTAVFTPMDTADYNNATGTVSLVVSRAPLVISANNASRSYNQTNPVFSGTLIGVTNSDNITATYSCSAIPISPPGTYAIVPNLLDPGSRLGNYSITTNNGTLTVTAGPPPTFTVITPNKGLTNGGTSVTITGSGFELGAGVLFASQPVTSVTVNSGTQITALTPAGALGTVSVVVTNPDSTSATLTNGFTYVGPPPSILTQPTNQLVRLGSNAVFQVTALYAGAYQWQFNGGNLTDNGRITGSHGNVLTVPGVQTTDAGLYQVVITNAFGSTNSAVVKLSILVPPGIVIPPQDQSVGIGGTATFTVGVNGTAPFIYQWLRGGSALSGATNSVLSIANVQTTNQGQQYSVVVSNAAGSATSTSATLSVLNYCASAQPSQAVYPMGSQVPLSVGTFNCSSQAAVPNSSVTVWISTGGTTRSLPVVTGASGSNVVNFVPLPTEAGTYQVAAALPGQSIPAAQGTFTLVGMSLSKNSITQKLTPGVAATNTITLSNLTSVVLSGISASVLGSAPDVQIQLNTPTTLTGNATNQLKIILTAPSNEPAQDQFYIQLTTAQGTTNVVLVTATVVPLVPNLVATPESLKATMVGGGQTLVHFTVANTGGTTSGPVQVLLPQAPWLTLVTPQPIPPMAPGQSNQVTLALTPPVNLPLGAYTGGLVLTSSNAQLQVPFQFDCLSTLKAVLPIAVQDELTYYGAGSPNVSNATVTIIDFLTGSNVATAVTGPSGTLLFSNLTAAYYNVRVVAPEHQSFKTTLLVAANQTNTLNAFLPLKLVTYTWVVTPTIYPDHYEFTLLTTFQTKVPWPVVTVNPGYIDLCAIQGQSTQINMTITNSGLISAQGLNLYFASHPNWSIRPLVSNLGDLQPESSIVVPVTITRLGSDLSAPEMIDAHLAYGVTTPSSTNSTLVPIYVLDANPLFCDPQHPTTPPICLSCLTNFNSSDTNGVTIQLPDYTFDTPQSALVQVKLQIQQGAVIARDAFNATLQLANNAGATVSNLSVNLTVYDGSNNVANSLFGFPPTVLNGLNAVDGTGVLANGASGQATWTLVPATNAAPQGPTQFKVGGSFSYILNGEPVTIPLFPVPITVLPTPILNVDYFLQHDVFSDDPFTPQIEPSIPFPLAILIKNIGKGSAHDFTITSSQPQIVENLNQLIIAFQLIASQIGTNQTLSPSMTMDFGNIGPLGSAEGLWYMTSTLEGQFISFAASYKHTDDLGNTNTSIINSVNIHDMNHVVRLTAPADDGLMDFLVNDTTNVAALPNIVYSSDGSTYPVTSITNGVATGVPSSGNSNVTLTVTAPAGWVYLQVVDPGSNSYPIVSVRRSDGTNLLVGPNVWQTPVRTNMVPPKWNNLIHIFDYNSTGTYTVTYGLPIVAPSVSTAIALNITPTNATLNAIVTPNGAPARVYFQWGTTTNYGDSTASTTLYASLYSAQAVAIGVGGLPSNTTNHFRVVAINSAGTTFGADALLVTPPLPPPVITLVTNQAIAVGQGLVITNHAQVETPPTIFSLDSSAPVGATITTNGIFRWSPACLQGSSTNLITIWATDSSSPPLSNSMSFVVIVSECVQVGIGSTVMQVGQTGGVAVTLLSTVGLTNLSWTLVNPSSRFTNWAFAFSNTAIANTIVQPVDSSQTFFNLNTTGGQTLQSPSLLGTIFFTALPGQSAFLPLVATNILGTKINGSVVGNIVSQPGRVVVIGPEPLLEAWIGSNSTRMLTLYGNLGTNYQLLFNTNLVTTNWQSGWSVTMTNLFEFFPADQTAPQIYYRAH